MTFSIPILIRCKGNLEQAVEDARPGAQPGLGRAVAALHPCSPSLCTGPDSLGPAEGRDRQL